ncbi:MAG: hypothetical protein Q9224_007001 [Gallowayella concinna]
MAAHLGLKRRFSTIATGDLSNHRLESRVCAFRHPVELLVAMLRNGDIARYARKLIIGPTMRPEEPSSDSQDEDEDEDEEGAAVGLFIKNSVLLRPLFPSVPSHFSDDRWVDDVFENESALYYSMPLELLPRVEKLELIDCAADHVPNQIHDCLMYFLQPVENEGPSLNILKTMLPALNNLKHITVICRSAYRFIGCERIYQLALLPSLQSLHANAIRSSWKFDPFPRGHGNGKLQHLHLQESEIHYRDFSLILSASKPNSLKTFEYIVDRGGLSYKTHEILDALRVHARESLDSLKIIDGRTGGSLSRPARSLSMGSLRQFSHLRHVHVEIDMLLGYSDRDRRVDDSWTWPSPSILHWLPQSLETLELVHRDSAVHTLDQILAGIHLGCPELPRLSRIIIHQVEGGQMISRDHQPKIHQHEE